MQIYGFFDREQKQAKQVMKNMKCKLRGFFCVCFELINVNISHMRQTLLQL